MQLQLLEQVEVVEPVLLVVVWLEEQVEVDLVVVVIQLEQMERQTLVVAVVEPVGDLMVHPIL
jgi:hypothetical protein